MVVANGLPSMYNCSDRQTDRQTGSDSPLLSVIIPVYNVAPYLAKCLASLEGQPHPQEMEFIVIDDGSTDGCAEILDEAARRDGRYRVFHQENQGVSMARNAGLSHVSGKYIAWVDPDDWIAPDWYEKQRPHLLDDVDMVYFDMVLVRDGRAQEMHWSEATRPMPREELFRGLATGMLASHLWSKTIKTLFWNKDDATFGPKISYCEDYTVLHHVVIDVQRIMYLHDALYYYLQRDGSIVNDDQQKVANVWASIDYARERMEFFHQHGIEVPDSGILFLEMSYLWLCSRSGVAPDSVEGRRIRGIRGRLWRYGYHLLLSADYPMWAKVQTLILMLHLERLWFSGLRRLREWLRGR